jgi:RyR domain
MLRHFAFPACMPLVLVLWALGVVAIGFGWWRSLPAVLPGDEVYALERVAGLTWRTLTAWQQPPDAPPMGSLSMLGLVITLLGLVFLICGATLRLLREFIHRCLIVSARDLRLVYVDDEAGHGIAETVSPATTVQLLPEGSRVPETLRLSTPLNERFWTRTLPRSAACVRELLALGRDAEQNIGLARRVIALRRESRQEFEPLIERLRVRIDSRALRWSIGRDGLAEFAGTAVDVRLTSLPEARCRRLLREQPPNKVRVFELGARPALVVIGLRETGLELIVRLCAQAQSPNFDPVVLVIVDAEANSIARDVLEACPALSLAVELRAVTLESSFPQSAGTLLARLAAEGLAATSIYLALEEQTLSDAWERELCSADRARGGPSALVLPVRFPRGRVAERTLLAEEESLDALPRQLHAAYLDRLKQQGLGTTTAAAVSWQELPFDYQEDNRSSVDHIWTKARDLDLQISEHCSPLTALPPAIDVEPLALAEHRRWIASRALAGWRVGEARADDVRVHPSLVPWAKLHEEERVKDRDFVLRIPATLGVGGFGLRRLVPFSVPRSRVGDFPVDDFLKAAQARGVENDAARLPLLVLALESAADFRLAQSLVQRGDVALSLVIAQSLAGLAVAAGQVARAATDLAEAAWTITLTRAECIDRVLERAPALGASA